MAVEFLQERIRKLKNPSMLELALSIDDLPPSFQAGILTAADGYGKYCLELLSGLKGTIPGVRVSFSAFALLGSEGLEALSQVLRFASEEGYYVLLDAPEILSQAAAVRTAEALLGADSKFPCDGLVISGYLGSDVIKPFLHYCKEGKKDIFVVARTPNRSAPELQDLLAGGRLVHMAAADYVNRYGADTLQKCGYTRVGLLAAANAANSLKNIRAKYPKLFLIADGYDAPNANAKNCAAAFDKLGHGAAVCAGGYIAAAWKSAGTDGADYMEQAKAAAERMKKNLCRYTTIL